MQNQSIKVSMQTAILSSRSLAEVQDSTPKPSSHAAARRSPAKTPKTAVNSGPSVVPDAPHSRPTDSGEAQNAAPKSVATKAKSPKSGAPKGGTNDDAKKRVRLKPETREQLLERLRNPPLSLHETSILLRVSRATVRRYADAGRLPCLRTPGGQRRFALRDIETFYRQLKTKR